MFHIVLYEPVIPQNTGSIARLCACTGATLHLIHPLGFQTDEKSVRRAGLDYWEHVEIKEHANWEAFCEKQKPQTLYFFSKKAGDAFTQTKFEPGDYFVFGSETEGLPDSIWQAYPEKFLQIPMRTHLVRSLNLAQAAAVVVYEAYRQNNYAGIEDFTGALPANPAFPLETVPGSLGS